MSLPVAILAGGLATRLGDLSAGTPKVLIDVAGKPFAVHQLHLLRSAGFLDVVFLVGHLGEQVEHVLGDGRRYGVSIRYIHDGPERRGTAGSIRQALPALGPAFLVMYGDSYLECDYAAVERAFVESGKPALMTVFHNTGRWDISNVQYESGRIRAYDKRHPTPLMQHIDYGLGAFRASVLEAYPNGQHLDLAAVYEDLVAADALAGHEVTTRFYEIGSPAGLAEARAHIAAQTGEQDDGVTTYAEQHLAEATRIIAAIDTSAIERMAALLADTRSRQGRLFFLGVGGSAANCSHAVNDFRKIAGLECYTPVDNVSELTARTNDEGWDSVFVAWLKGSRLRSDDALCIFSVGGGSLEKNISPNLVRALQYAKEVGARVVGVVGRDGGYTAQVADACVIIPTVNPETVTPHSEAFQAVIWHLLVSHPALKKAQTKWESAR